MLKRRLELLRAGGAGLLQLAGDGVMPLAPASRRALAQRGQKFDIKSDIKGYKEDVWNEFEITLTGTKVEFKCNGEVARMANTKVEKSVFGVRAEFGPIQIRKLRVKGG